MAGVKDGVVHRGSTWSYVIRVRDPETGRSRPRWVGGFRTEREAKRARDEARVAANRSEYVNRDTITLGAYLDGWLAVHQVEVKPQTFASYKDVVRRYVVPRLGTTRLQALQPAMLTRLYADLRATGGVHGTGLSPRTVDYVHAVMRKALKDAVVVDRLLASSPADRAKRPRKDAPGPREVWSARQLGVFLESAREHRLHPFFHVAAFTGARRGELLNLRWSDVDLVAGVLQIRGTAAVVEGQWVEGTTKGGNARTVTLDVGTVEVLRAHRAAQHVERLAAGTDWPSSDYVFTRGVGLPLYPDPPSQLMPKLIERQNQSEESEPLPRMRLHDLRHVHATVLLLAGVPVHVVAGRLGHADPSITLRVYAHVLREAESQAADVFAEAIRAAC